MSTKTTVVISENEYAIYRPILLIFRILGLFPVAVKRSRSKLLMYFSPVIMIYGFTVGAFTISMAYWGIITEITANKEYAVRVTSDTDKLVLLIDLAVYSSVFFCGIFLAPTDYKRFFIYLQFLQEVDYIVKTPFKALDKYILLVAITIVVSLNMLLGYIDLSQGYEFFGDKIGLLGVLHRFMALDFLVLMVNVMECINQVLLNGLKKRIERLNELLTVQYNRMNNWQMVDVNKHVLLFTEPTSMYNNNENHLIVNDQNRIGDNQTRHVIDLCKTYQIILDATDVLNDFLGVSTVAMVLAIFWALIESSYFFLLACIETRGELQNAIELPVAFFCVILFHVFRVLLITEPTHVCLSQIQLTKCLVCKLLSCNVGRKYKKWVSRFAMVLELRPLQFAAKGFFNVDRSLFTSLLDTIVTLLIILLQYRDNFTL